MKKIAISIVNYNSAIEIKNFIKSIQIIDKNEYDIFVIDNNSNKKDINILDSISENIYVTKNNLNEGFAKAQNKNIEKIISINKYDYVLICNPDIILSDPYTFQTLYKEAKENNASIIGPLVTYYPKKNKIYFAGGLVDKYTSVTKMLLKNKKISEVDLTNGYECDFITGCFMMIKIDTFKIVGKIPEDYFLYFEESDFCLNAKMNGLKIFYTPRTVVHHKVSSSIGYISNIYLYYMVRNFFIFGNKYTSKKHLPIFYLYYIFIWVPGYIFLAIYYKKYKGIYYIIKGLFNIKY